MSFGKRADTITGVLLIVIAAYVYIEAAAMPTLRRGLGPGGYPIFIAWGLGILGILLSIRSLVTRDECKPLFTISWEAVGRVLFFMALTFFYIEAVLPVGFVLASIIYLLIGIYFFGYRRPGVNVIVSICLTLGIYLSFRYIFLVLIPTGYLFS